MAYKHIQQFDQLFMLGINNLNTRLKIFVPWEYLNRILHGNKSSMIKGEIISYGKNLTAVATSTIILNSLNPDFSQNRANLA